MSNYYGDYATSAIVYMDFDSFTASTGASSATSNFASSDIQIYKNGGTTQRSSANGITVSTSFDSQTGLQMVAIDTSDNTDAGFYAAGGEYNVAVADVTIDSQTVRFWLGSFSIQRTGGALALIIARTPNATAGAAGGLFIAGTNAATTITTALTTTFTGNLTGSVGSVTGLTASNLDATISSRATPTNITAGTITTVTNLTNAPTAGDFTAVMKTSLNAATPAVTVSDKTGFSLSSAGNNSVADALLNRDMSLVSDTNARSPLNGFRFLRNKFSVALGTLTVTKEDDTTTAWTATISTDAAALPVIGSDPA